MPSATPTPISGPAYVPTHHVPIHHARRTSKPLTCPFCGARKENKPQLATHMKVTNHVHLQQALAAVGVVIDDQRCSTANDATLPGDFVDAD